jgi:hypothetical protein
MTLVCSDYRIEFLNLSLMLRPMVSRSWNKAPILGLRPDLYYCQTVARLLMRGSLSDERMGLQFTTASGPRQLSYFRVRVPWTRDHILLSQILDFTFRLLLRLAGLRWRYSTPPPHGFLPNARLNSLLYHRICVSYSSDYEYLYCCLHIRLPSRCLAMNVSCGATIPAFRRHVTILTTGSRDSSVGIPMG